MNTLILRAYYNHFLYQLELGRIFLWIS